MASDALRVATDPDFKFELAVQLGELRIAKEIIESHNDDVGENSGNSSANSPCLPVSSIWPLRAWIARAI